MVSKKSMVCSNEIVFSIGHQLTNMDNKKYRRSVIMCKTIVENNVYVGE